MKSHKKTSIFSLFLLAFFLFIKCSEMPEAINFDKSSESYMPFPLGFNYPQDNNTINKWISAGDRPAIRKHAWSLFAGLNQKSKGWKRVWQTWHPIGEVIPERDSIVKNPKTRLYPPGIKFPYPVVNPKSLCFSNGNFFFFTSFLLVGSTFYNKEAADWISEKNLGEKSTLDRFYKEGRKDIPMSPPTAMVMKNVYWPVSGRQQDYFPYGTE